MFIILFIYLFVLLLFSQYGTLFCFVWALKFKTCYRYNHTLFYCLNCHINLPLHLFMGIYTLWDFYIHIYDLCLTSSISLINLVFVLVFQSLWQSMSYDHHISSNICFLKTFNSDLMCFWELDLSVGPQIWTQICVWSISFIFYAIHSSHHEIFTFWGAILRFPSKSLDKSSDCADFIKSMDLSDLSECL